MLQNPAISRIYSSAVQGKKLGRALHGLIRLELSPCLCQVPPRLPCLSPLHGEVTAVFGLQMVKRSLRVWETCSRPCGQRRGAGREPPLARSPSAPRPTVTALSSQLSLDTCANGLCRPWLTPGLPCGHTCRMAASACHLSSSLHTLR